jgi:Ca2+-binding RTX toxin-like protein
MIVGTLGADRIRPGQVTPGVTGGLPSLLPDQILGYGGADTIDGGGGADTIDGNLGNDLLSGGAGNDIIDGGLDDNTIFGGDGDDWLGDRIDDLLPSQFGNDLMFGGAGNDTINGDPGFDRLFGEAGNDVLWGGSDADTVDGGGGNDTIDGGDGNDSLLGGPGNDLLTGFSDEDTINGGPGNDTINGGFDNYRNGTFAPIGSDVLTGGGGADVFFGPRFELDGSRITDFGADDVVIYQFVRLAGFSLAVTQTVGLFLELDGGNVRIFFDALPAAGRFVVAPSAAGEPAYTSVRFVPQQQGTARRDTLTGAALTADTLDGGAGDDLLRGLAGADSLLGGAGRDLLDGGAGNDRLFGGTEADVLSGGAGADLLVGGLGADRFVYGTVADSTAALRDLILGFEGAGAAAGDLIDLRAVFAGTLSFVPAGGAFTAAGQVRVVAQGANSLVQVNTGGSLAAEMEILIGDGAVPHTAYTAADFLL